MSSDIPQRGMRQRARSSAAVRKLDETAKQAGLPSYGDLASMILVLATQVRRTSEGLRRMGRSVVRKAEIGRLECAAMEGIELVGGTIDSLPQAVERCRLEDGLQLALARIRRDAARGMAARRPQAPGGAFDISWDDDIEF